MEATRRLAPHLNVMKNIKTNLYCGILAILSMIFGELIWWTDLLWLRSIVMIPLTPVIYLFVYLELYGNVARVLFKICYLLQWTIPSLILLFLTSKTKLRNSTRMHQAISYLTNIGVATFALYLLIYGIFRVTGNIEFQKKTMPSHGGMGSGKLYSVSNPIIHGPRFFDILYPLASFEGNHFHK